MKNKIQNKTQNKVENNKFVDIELDDINTNNEFINEINYNNKRKPCTPILAINMILSGISILFLCLFFLLYIPYEKTIADFQKNSFIINGTIEEFDIISIKNTNDEHINTRDQNIDNLKDKHKKYLFYTVNLLVEFKYNNTYINSTYCTGYNNNDLEELNQYVENNYFIGQMRYFYWNRNLNLLYNIDAQNKPEPEKYKIKCHNLSNNAYNNLKTLYELSIGAIMVSVLAMCGIIIFSIAGLINHYFR